MAEESEVALGHFVQFDLTGYRQIPHAVINLVRNRPRGAIKWRYPMTDTARILCM